MRKCAIFKIRSCGRDVWTFTYIFQSINQRTNQSEWMNEWMSEWVNEWMNEWTNERTNERTNARATDRPNERILYKLSSGRVQGMCFPPPPPPTWDVKPSSSCPLLNFFYLTSHLHHSLVIHHLLRKNLDPPWLWYIQFSNITTITILGSQTLLWTCAE